MAKTTAGDKPQTSTQKESKYPIDAKEMPKLVLSDKIPTSLSVDVDRTTLTVKFPHKVDNEKNYLDKYTEELRVAFAKASMQNWKAVFFIGEKRYFSTL